MMIEPIDRKPGCEGRLNVLWIDDQFDKITPRVWLDWEPWFTVTIMDSPVELEKLLQQSEARMNLAPASTDGLQRFPFDIYLTDFRLCENKENCKQQAHEEQGLHAPAAGFMAGLLAALRAPRHIQCIIPYSAYDEEYGSLWKLASRLSPTTLTVMWDEAITKGNRRQDELRKLGSATFRRAIENSCKRGASHIPFAVRSKIESLIASGGSDLPATATLAFASGDAIREVLLGSLFNDHLSMGRSGGTVPATVVAVWLAGIPASDPLEVKARELAGLYWRLRRTPFSRLRFSIIHQARSKGVETIDADDRAAFSVGWLGQMVHDTCIEQDRNHALRLATLFLIVGEEAHKYSVRQHGGLSERASEALKFMRRNLGDPEKVIDSFVRVVSGDAVLQDKVVEAFRLIDAAVAADDGRVAGEDHEILRAYTPFGEVDFCHLMDPLPEKSSSIGWGKEKKIGQAFKRAGLDIIKLVNDGDSSQLTEAERLAVARYALDLGLPRTNWPNWLR